MGRARRRSTGLRPNWREQVSGLARPGWARTVHARRVLAGALVLVAGVLAVRGDPAQRFVDVLVASQDLPPGHVLTEDDVRVAAVASRSAASGVLAEVGSVTGRTLAGGVRGGEQLTDVRVVGPSLAALATGDSGAVAVPVRLSDAEVAELLRPGDTVDVLVLGRDAGQVGVVAENATVLSVAPGGAQRGSEGRLVVVGVRPGDAAAVAGASLESVVTVTFT